MSKSSDIFPIFELARELRDLIYHHSLTPVKTYSLPSGFKLTATHLPQPKLLLLSHQLTEEYLSVASKLTTLTIDDHCLGGSGYQLPSLPKEVLGVERVKFNVACTAWRDAAGEIEFHDGWIRGLLGQMREKSGGGKVSIHMHFGSNISAIEYEAALTWSGCWTTELADLDVRPLALPISIPIDIPCIGTPHLPRRHRLHDMGIQRPQDIADKMGEGEECF